MEISIIAMAPGRQPVIDGQDHIYALAWDEQYRDYATHLFEPHTHDWHIPNKPSYIDDVNDTDKPVLVLKLGRFKNEELFPDVPKELDYFESTFAYMLAYAITKKPTMINISGIRMATDEEYVYQRANAEYMIGYARGMGIEVNIINSTVCEYSAYLDMYPERYGDYVDASR